jgi:hypothetical protein
MGSWYLTTGVGILLRRKWGYFFFKSFLFFLLLGFPIVTFFAYKSLKYIKRNNIKTLLNNLLDDDEYIKVLEVLILNKDVFETNKYNNNLKMILIDGYKGLFNELNNP